MTTTTTTTTFGNGNTTKAAHAIRKELAAKFDVPARYINFGDCLKSAMGKRPTSKIRNCFGKILGTSGDSLVKMLLCDPETPVSWGFSDMVDYAVEELGLNRFRTKQILGELCKGGFLNHSFGFWSVTLAKRPFPQPMFS